MYFILLILIPLAMVVYMFLKNPERAMQIATLAILAIVVLFFLIHLL